MKKQNIDIRAAAKENRIYLYEIADGLSVSEATFIRWLRKELPENQKKRVFAIIAEKRKEKTSDDND